MGKRLTNEGYRTKLAMVGSGVVVLEDYKGSATKILHKCPCGTLWKILPGNALNGGKCRICGVQKCASSKSKTRAQHVAKLDDLGSGVTLIGEFLGNTIKTQHKCSCGRIWLATPISVSQGGSCRECGKRNVTSALRKSRAEYVKEISLSNPSVKLLGDYTKNSTPTLHSCVCGEEWLCAPISVKAGSHCPKCRARKISEAALNTRQDHVDKLRNQGRSVSLVGNYVDTHTPAWHSCSCGNKWLVRPYDAVGKANKRCNVCSRRAFPAVFSGGHVKILRSKPEELAIRSLLSSMPGLKPTEILCDSSGRIPGITYYMNGVRKSHRPDLYIPSMNLLYEVKDLGTFGMTDHNYFGVSPDEVFSKNKAKAKAALKAGYDYRFMVMTRQGEIVLPSNWHKQSRASVRKKLELQ